jgi:hypothetical protein
MRYSANVSVSARAYTGAMLNVRALWAQRRKRDEGISRLLVRSTVSKWTATLWRWPASSVTAGLSRPGRSEAAQAARARSSAPWSSSRC